MFVILRLPGIRAQCAQKKSHILHRPLFFSVRSEDISYFLQISDWFMLLSQNKPDKPTPTGPHRLVVALKVVQPTAHVRQDIVSLLQVRFEPFTLQLLDVVLNKNHGKNHLRSGLGLVFRDQTQVSPNVLGQIHGLKANLLSKH